MTAVSPTTVCCRPSAAPLRVSPPSSAAAANETVFQPIEIPPARTKSGNTTTIGASTSTAAAASASVEAIAMRRSGTMRLCTRSDQTPLHTRITPPTTWLAASAPAAVTGLRPRASCRNSTTNPAVAAWATQSNELPIESRHRRASRSVSGSGELSDASGRTPSRMNTALAHAPSRHVSASASSATWRPSAAARRGSVSAAAAAATIIPACRIASASPR